MIPRSAIKFCPLWGKATARLRLRGILAFRALRFTFGWIIHQEFSDAVKEGMAASAIWWEDCLRANAMTGNGNATSAIFGLKNRATDDWRDRRETDLTSSDGSMTPKGISEDVITALNAIAGKITGGDSTG
jgi:hypothetical protein